MNPDKELVLFWGGEISNNYPKSKRIHLIKRTNWILPCIVQNTTLTGAPTIKLNQKGQTTNQKI